MHQTFQLNVWYCMEDLGQIRLVSEGVLRSSGFELQGLPEPPFGSGDLVQLEGQRAWCSLNQRTEGHAVFEVKASLAPERLAQPFLAAFEQMINEPGLMPAECTLAGSNSEVYPFFTHSLFRGSVPLKIHEEQEDGGQPIVHTSVDTDYWDQAGRALHFVSQATLERTAAPTPEVWSKKIGAALVTHPSGVVFDCGWSAANATTRASGHGTVDPDP